MRANRNEAGVRVGFGEGDPAGDSGMRQQPGGGIHGPRHGQCVLREAQRDRRKEGVGRRRAGAAKPGVAGLRLSPRPKLTDSNHIGRRALGDVGKRHGRTVDVDWAGTPQRLETRVHFCRQGTGDDSLGGIGRPDARVPAAFVQGRVSAMANEPQTLLVQPSSADSTSGSVRAGTLASRKDSQARPYIGTITSTKGNSKAASNSQPRRLQLE
jgi:hypothetical protein